MAALAISRLLYHCILPLQMALALASLATSGCSLTALELEQATDPLSDSIPNLLTAQIAHNLKIKDRNPFALPGEVVIAGGSSQVSNQLILPTSGLATIGRLFGTFSLQNQNQWQQGWSLTPVTDVGDIQRLDALYRYAPGYGDLCQFVNEYSQAVINAPSSPVLRLTDFAPGDASKRLRLQDYNFPAPEDYKRSPNTLPETRFGPPAALPTPPMNIVSYCQNGGPFEPKELSTPEL